MDRKILLLSLVAISVFPVAITMTFYRIDLLYALKIIGIRLSYTPAYIQYLYFLLVPSRFGFLHGRTSPSLSWLTGQDYFNMPEYVIRFPYPNAPAHASASGPFVGDLYANFGVSGVLLGGIAAGIMMQSLQIWLVRRRKTVANIAAYAFLLYVSWTLTYRPLQVVVWSGGVFFVFLVSFVLVVLETILRIRGSLRHEPATAH